MDGGAWSATVHRVVKSWTWLSTHACNPDQIWERAWITRCRDLRGSLGDWLISALINAMEDTQQAKKVWRAEFGVTIILDTDGQKGFTYTEQRPEGTEGVTLWIPSLGHVFREDFPHLLPHHQYHSEPYSVFPEYPHRLLLPFGVFLLSLPLGGEFFSAMDKVSFIFESPQKDQ